jgi:hypothetical protein
MEKEPQSKIKGIYSILISSVHILPGDSDRYCSKMKTWVSLNVLKTEKIFMVSGYI